jgi:outer membrane protein assembly factor BamB
VSRIETETRWHALAAVAALLAIAAVIAAVPAAARAAIADQSVAYQLDPQHDGNLTSVPLTPPLAKQWSDTFGNGLSYPLVVNGVVYVSAGPTGGQGGGSNLYAINEATGDTRWSRTLGSGTYGWSDIAYDAGRVFGVNEGGLLSGVDSITGALDWSVQLPGQYMFTAPPIAVDGIVYVGGAGSGGTLYAVDEQSGRLLWTDSVANGDDSSPAFDGTNVFVTYPCQYYAFGAITGATAWHDNDGCDGGGGATPVVADGHVFIRDWTSAGLIVNSSTGAIQGPLSATQAPAVAGGMAYELSGATLEAVTDDGLGITSWSFAGDGDLTTAPLVTDGVVWVGSSSGNLYALDPATGHQLWSTNVGTPLAAGSTGYVGAPFTGLGAGNGALIVPAGDSLIAYAPAPANAVPHNQLTPSIGGTALDGDLLAADVGVWSNLPTSYSYQWRRCSASGTGCTDISAAGAQTANYTAQDADVGSTLQVVVTATNAAGDSTAVASSLSPVIAPPQPTLIEDPTISGTDQVGAVLTVSPGTWSNAPTRYIYQWQDCTSPASCTDIPGATTGTYTLQPSDQGETIEVRVQAGNTGGPSAPTEAGPTAVIQAAPSPPTNAAQPRISGTLVAGQMLTVTQGTWLHNPTTIVDQWERCNADGGACQALVGATGRTYTLTDADGGSTLEVSETATNDVGTGGPIDSAPTGVIAQPPVPPVPAAPVDLTPPEVSGLPVPGALVSVAVGQWSGSSVWFTYQWELCETTCNPIPGANGSLLSPTVAEDGARLEVIVTASNGGGSTVAVSSATGPVGTISQDIAALRSALSPRSRSATVAAVLHGKGATLPVSNLETGNLTIDWYGRTAGSRKRTLVATGRLKVIRGQRTFRISLTRAGARLLRRAGTRVEITAEGELIGVGYALTATRRFTL